MGGPSRVDSPTQAPKVLAAERAATGRYAHARHARSHHPPHETQVPANAGLSAMTNRTKKAAEATKHARDREDRAGSCALNARTNSKETATSAMKPKAEPTP